MEASGGSSPKKILGTSAGCCIAFAGVVMKRGSNGASPFVVLTIRFNYVQGQRLTLKSNAMVAFQ